LRSINTREVPVDKKIVVNLPASFEDMVQPDSDSGAEFWFARDLQMLLGYAKWENFLNVIERAITSCQTTGNDPGDHFLEIRKMVDLGSGQSGKSTTLH
jgi:DNA-damage-inducible protein D